MADVERSGLLIILSSPSGAGKSTLARRLMEWDPSLNFSVSATTRAPREGEKEGREYFFRTRAEFKAMVDSGEMLEHAEVFGNLYGSPKGPVQDAINDGRDRQAVVTRLLGDAGNDDGPRRVLLGPGAGARLEEAVQVETAVEEVVGVRWSGEERDD